MSPKVQKEYAPQNRMMSR